MLPYDRCEGECGPCANRDQRNLITGQLTPGDDGSASLQHTFEHFRPPMIWLRSDWKLLKISACKRITSLIARPRRCSCEGPPTLSVSTIAAVLVQRKPTPPPAKAPSAFRSGSIRIEASVGPRGACRGRVLTARRAAHRSEGPRPRAAALRCRVRLAICH